MYQAQIKHKAMHGGYKQKPSKKSVKALLDMYTECVMETSILVTNLILEPCINVQQRR